MFKRLLVPLDGSKLAEAALPAAASLAQLLGASVMLIHVIEEDAPEEIHSDHHLTDPQEAEQYLAEVGRTAFPSGAQVEYHVHTSQVKDVARSIVEHAYEFTPDLIVMCTHGKGGPRDWLFGSIAQQVIAIGKTPVLLIPPEHAQGAFPCGRILLPLDGSPEHEQGAHLAVSLAEACGSGLYMLMVIPTPGTLKWKEAAISSMLPGATSVMLDLAEEGGREYLSRRVNELHQEHPAIPLGAEVARGDPVNVIVSTAQRIDANLIVFGTHGKTGMDAFWEGSVTPKVSGRSHRPLLLVPVHES